MKALVIFDTVAQDTSLAMEITREMEELGWTEFASFSYAYEKEAEGSYEEIEADVIANVDAATFEAEWENVNYLYVIGNEAPKFKVSLGNVAD